MPSARHSTSSTGRDACRWKAPNRSQLTPGDTVLIPPNVKHWHGAAPDRLFIHLAFQEVTDQGAGTKWLEKVNDADYQAPTVDPD